MDAKSTLAEVTAALTALKPEGTFAVEEACPPDDLRIEVAGIGPIRFPISAATARKLCAVARQAPFGRRDRTLYDRRVRDTWELDGEQVTIDADAWNRTLEPLLARIRDRLGLAKRSKLRAVFDKMLVYAPGQFFAAHQDSERARDMIGSLVVELPSRHEGGATVVEHHDQKRTFQGAAKGGKDLSLLAFYADCRHAVEPVRSGYRVVLTYRLHHRGGPSKEAPRDLGALVDRLAGRVEAYFSTPVADRYARTPPERPDRLIYLLDHEYTQQSLGWDHLKNGDRLRVSALRTVAERLGCEVFLTLADVHEQWSCEDDWDGGYRWDRRGRYAEEEEDGAGDDDGDHELTELIDTEVDLRHWVAAGGEVAPSVPMSAGEEEVCFTLPSVDMKPWQSEHEGYMGNYGNTVDRWYHRAALVMWPRARSFAVRAEVSPSWAVDEIQKDIAAGNLKGARDKAGSLLSFWNVTAAQEQHAAFLQKLCAILAALDDAGLAEALLAPFGPHRLTPGTLPRFVALVERFGLSWAQRLFSMWSERAPYAAPRWSSSLPQLTAALSASPGKHGRPLALWLLVREVTSFQEEHTDASRRPRAYRDDARAVEETTGELLALFESARELGAASIRDGLIAFLTAPGTALPLMTLGALLRRCREGRKPAEVRALGLGALHRHAVTSLQRALAAPARSLDDWSIEPPSGCQCALCKELAAFLRAPDRIKHAWPLAKERRRHIHGVIDGNDLPVSHATLRSGRPQTLVLEKQNALFEGEAILREQQRMLSAWLKKERAAFSGGG